MSQHLAIILDFTKSPIDIVPYVRRLTGVSDVFSRVTVQSEDSVVVLETYGITIIL